MSNAVVTVHDWADLWPENEPPWQDIRELLTEVNTLTNERDLARRANEQNIKIIKNLRKQLRKDKQRRIDARPDPIPPDDYDLGS